MKLPKLRKEKRNLLNPTTDDFSERTFFPYYFEKIPAINISEDKKNYKIEIAVPGFDKKDIKIEFDNNLLIISSEKEKEKKSSKKNWLKQEYSYSSFCRRIPLPEGIDENKIKAKIRNGVLTIKVGKQEGFNTVQKKIEVK